MTCWNIMFSHVSFLFCWCFGNFVFVLKIVCSFCFCEQSFQEISQKFALKKSQFSESFLAMGVSFVIKVFPLASWVIFFLGGGGQFGSGEMTAVMSVDPDNVDSNSKN